MGPFRLACQNIDQPLVAGHVALGSDVAVGRVLNLAGHLFQVLLLAGAYDVRVSSSLAVLADDRGYVVAVAGQFHGGPVLLAFYLYLFYPHPLSPFPETLYHRHHLTLSHIFTPTSSPISGIYAIFSVSQVLGLERHTTWPKQRG